jgi:hypothetical protein
LDDQVRVGLASIHPQAYQSIDPLAPQENFPMTHNQPTPQPAASTSAGAWGLRYPGLVIANGGKNEIKEFTGMWRLNPDADLVAFTKALRRAAGSIHRESCSRG